MAQDLPPQQPQLVIDAGMHTAPIKRVGVDAACTLLATGSWDKTVRLWRLPEGKLLRSLRPPIGAGDDGKIFAVAMAPDGSWVAAGGWTKSHSHWVYVFDGTTGAVMTRLGPLTNVINQLAVSRDGQYLAATPGRGEGLRVWQRTGAGLADWRQVAEDKEYGGAEAYGAAFNDAGVLYTASYDGNLRRYEPGYTAKPIVVAARGGKMPFSISVQPTGDSVAVGFSDSRVVDIYDATTLAWRFAADTKGVDNGNLSSVVWSADGRRLYAGGQYQKNLRRPIRVWERNDQGSLKELKDLEGTDNTVHHLLPCGDSLAMAAADPAFGLYSPDGSRRLWRENVQPDQREAQTGRFAVSPDGRRLSFGLKWRADFVSFDLAAERLTDAPTAASDLYAADTKSLAVTDWKNERNPKLGANPIRLQRYETARSLAIAPDKERFVLGADFDLRAFDKNGKLLWEKSAPGVVWGANIPRDGKVVVAAYGDGTIRWHRLSDGRELLALFVHVKDRRWVAWTPTGYYLASPGAESLIGWHVNRGWVEAADFFPADRFRDRFNRPDIVKLALDLEDEEKAVAEANRRAGVKGAEEGVRAVLPPVIEIMRPHNDATFSQEEVTLEYIARSPTGKRISDIDVRINGAAFRSPVAVPLSPRGDEPIRLTLTLPAEDVIVTLVAREGGKASEPTSIRLRWDGVKPGETSRPRLRGLFVGVSNYKLSSLKLGFAAKDATDLAAFFTSQEGKAYRKVEAKVLPDADRTAVLEGLDWLESGSEDGDVNLLFLAGHGVTDEKGYFYYLAAESLPDSLRATAVGRDEILRTIKNRRGAMVVMLDACQSGASADGAMPAQSRVDMNRLANELGDKTLGVFLYASALGRQFSYERKDWGNGAFTKAMIEGLSGKADREKTGFVDTDELALYVRRRVMDLTKKLQEPVRIKPDAAPEMRLVRLGT